MLLSILYIMWPIHLQGLRLLLPAVKEEMHLQENTILTLTFVVKVTLNVAQYSLHHVAYSPARFEVSTSNISGGDAFSRKYIF